MPQILTKYFGKINYSAASRLHFSAGLPGFEDQPWFLLLNHPDTRPLAFLQSLARPELCFLSVPVQVVAPDYHLRLSAEDAQALGLATVQPAVGREVLALALLSLAPAEPPTANLLAPVVIHLGTREALQAIQNESDYSHRHPLAAPPVGGSC